MEIALQRKLIVYIFVTFVHSAITFAPDSDRNSTHFKDVNALMLLKMGRQLNKPLLTLLGMAITNLHPCAKWTTWSGCTAVNSSYIGIRKRTRTCQSGNNLQESILAKTETDFGICVGYCPNDYTVTPHGYCMKVYTSQRSQEEAEKQCNNDGGHLVNVDSDLKCEDVKSFRHVLGYSNHAFIGGRRNDRHSPWIGSDGSPVEFSRWGYGKPDNYFCLLLKWDNFWYDVPCTSSLAFICEIISGPHFVKMEKHLIMHP